MHDQKYKEVDTLRCETGNFVVVQDSRKAVLRQTDSRLAWNILFTDSTKQQQTSFNFGRNVGTETLKFIARYFVRYDEIISVDQAEEKMENEVMENEFPKRKRAAREQKPMEDLNKLHEIKLDFSINNDETTEKSVVIQTTKENIKFLLKLQNSQEGYFLHKIKTFTTQKEIWKAAVNKDETTKSFSEWCSEQKRVKNRKLSDFDKEITTSNIDEL